MLRLPANIKTFQDPPKKGIFSATKVKFLLFVNFQSDVSESICDVFKTVRMIFEENVIFKENQAKMRNFCWILYERFSADFYLIFLPNDVFLTEK